MFTKPNSCPVCHAPWFEHEERCLSCGSVAELYYERPLPNPSDVDREKIEKNIARVRKYLVEHENHGLARYTLGLSYTNLGLVPEGLVEINRAAQLLPEKVQVSYEAVVLAVKEGDLSQGTLDLIDRVIKRKPDFKEALYLKGVILRKRGDLTAAARTWKAACRIDENYLPAIRELNAFVLDRQSLLRDPKIARAIPNQGLSPVAIDYLRAVTKTEPKPPPRLGETSMAILGAIWSTKAAQMRKMYSADYDQFQTEMQWRARGTSALEEDVQASSELCIRAVETAESLATAEQRRALQKTQTETISRGQQLSVAERSAILDAAVQRYQKQGWALITRTETTAQLSKKHEFSCCWAVFLTLIVIGIILYLLWYLTAKKEHLIFLEVDGFGQVFETRS